MDPIYIEPGVLLSALIHYTGKLQGTFSVYNENDQTGPEYSEHHSWAVFNVCRATLVAFAFAFAFAFANGQLANATCLLSASSTV